MRLVASFHSSIFLFLGCLMCLPVTAINQLTGTPYLTHFSLQPANISNQVLDAYTTSVLTGRNQFVYATNPKGVLLYKGSQWLLVRTPTSPLSLAAHSAFADRIYVGCQSGFGYVQTTENGISTFTDLSKEFATQKPVIQLVEQGDWLYCLTEKRLYQWNVKDNTLTQQWPTVSQFTGLFTHAGKVYVSIAGIGLQQINGKQLRSIKNTKELASANILSAIRLTAQKTLLATDKNQLMSFNGQSVTQVTIKDQAYLSTHQLTSATDLSEYTYALGTISGGCIVVNKQTGQTTHLINFQTGLPDDEIQALTKDKQGNLWICHPLGVSRANFRFPITNYTSYPGLQGNITQVLAHREKLYVATTEGLFYLDKSGSYSEVAGHLRQGQIERITRTVTINESKKGFLGRLFGMKDNVRVRQKREVIDISEDQSASAWNREAYALNSIPYIFKRVAGYTGRCNQLILVHGQILAAGSSGVYQLTDARCTPILANVYTHKLYVAATAGHKVWVGAQTGLYILTPHASGWHSESYPSPITSTVYSIHQKDNVLWMGGINQVWQVVLNRKGGIQKTNVYSLGLSYEEPVSVFSTSKEVGFLADGQLYRFDPEAKKLVKQENTEVQPKGIVYGQGNNVWSRVRERWHEISEGSDAKLPHAELLNLFPSVVNIFVDESRNTWVVDNANQLYQINAKKHLYTFPALHVYLERVTDKKGTELPLDDIDVDHDNSRLQFVVSTRQYGQESAIQYQYRITGLGEEWSEWQSEPVLYFPFLPNGSFTLQVRARDAQGSVSEASEFDFRIRPPFWKSGWFQLLVVVMALGGVVAVMRYRTLRLEKANRLLEQRVHDRTMEIRVQKEQIELQKSDIELQKRELEIAYSDITKKNHHIIGSINYAQKIQQAILPQEAKIRESFPEAFVLFQPRDTVSGDFYWFAEKENQIIIAAVDCTGHGVPGAFMSMIGNTLLNQIVNEKGVTQPAQILNLLHVGVRTALKQGEDNSERQDGMDIALCCFNKHTQELHYAGANNSLYVVENGILTEVKADKFGIGGVQKEAQRLFTNHVIAVTAQTTCYLFTDGYEDQFGGPDNRKFMAKRFKQLLTEIQPQPAVQQQQILAETIQNWKGSVSQVDDILVMGFQLPVSVPVASVSASVFSESHS